MFRVKKTLDYWVLVNVARGQSQGSPLRCPGASREIKSARRRGETASYIILLFYCYFWCYIMQYVYI